MAENTTPDDELIYEAADGVGILTLNRYTGAMH